MVQLKKFSGLDANLRTEPPVQTETSEPLSPVANSAELALKLQTYKAQNQKLN